MKECNLFFFPSGSETATAVVHVRAEEEDISKLRTFYENADKFLAELGDIAENARRYTDAYGAYENDHSEPGRVVYEYDGTVEKEKELFFNEEDTIASVLYGYISLDLLNDSDYDKRDSKANAENNKIKFPGLERNRGTDIVIEGLTVTVDYKGDKYTNIEKVSRIDGILGTGGIRFAAEKNGGEQDTYYLFTKTNLSSGSEDKGYTIVQSPSTGIVGENSKYHYAGNRLYFCSSDPEVDLDIGATVHRKDEDGNLIVVQGFFDEGGNLLYGPINLGERGEKHDWVKAAHLFFERNGEDFTFSVLKNGKLYKRISKTAETVIFHYISFDFAEPDAERDAMFDVVFKKTNGKYVNEGRYIDNMTKCVNSSIIVPPIPDGDKLGADDYFAFYNECIMALRKAFENPERYFTTKYQWEPSITTSVEWSTTTRENFATDNPPRCQITIERINNSIYTFSFEDAVITAFASVHCSDMGFGEDFYVPFPDFEVDSVAFTEKDGTITLSYSKDPLYIEITDAKTGQTYEGKFALLRTEPDFDSTDIPLNLVLKSDWVEVKDNLDLCRKIKDAILRLGIEKCIDLFNEYSFNEYSKDPRGEISKILYNKDDGMVPDENVISMALQLKKEYDRTKKIPNIAIVGQAGTGKTTLANNLAKIFKKSLEICTPASLKAGYIGHTKYEVVQRLVDAVKGKKILFIDEAYQLMDDPFGAEAVTVLLPLMSGDQRKVDASLDRGQKPTIKIDFGDVEAGKEDELGYISIDDKVVHTFKPGVVPIWISGYENEVRMMISRNQGLYRRLKKVVIKPPVTSDLLKNFNKRLELKITNDSGKTSRNAAMLKKYFNDNGEAAVEKFFGWGSQAQNSKYFGNNAGVEEFLGNCLDAIDFGENLGPQIEKIISSTKQDIKRQLATVRNTDDNNRNGSLSAVSDIKDTINVITDIDTRFSDLVGCTSQIAYMQSIIEMLVNKGVYEDFNLTAPRGALMEGLPGVGKTFIARAMAGELQERFQKEAIDKRFGFVSFSASELGNKPASYIASIFSAAEEYDACILFIDEVDAIAKHRNGNPFYDRYLELIKQMDGIEKRSNVFILAATNAPENLDPAFVRSGRIDKRLTFILPDKSARKELARRAMKKRIKTLVNFDCAGKEEDIDVVAELIAKRTSGYTAGDIDNVINTAFIMYHQFIRYGSYINDSGSLNAKDFFKSYPFIRENRRGRLEIFVKDKGKTGIRDTELNNLYLFIDEEIERMQAGDPNYKKREEEFSTDKNGNCSSTAVHEVGHAVVSLMLGENVFDVITTLPRGNALGYVSHSELRLVTKSDYEKRICVLMGGRIAEEIVYGKDNVSTGAVSDMQQATDYARKMIEMWGFSDRFGFMSLSIPTGKYLGGDCSYTCSQEFRENSDIAVNELLQKLYRDTSGMISGKKELIKNLAKRVFENETMTGEEFKKLYEVELKQNSNNE